MTVTFLQVVLTAAATFLVGTATFCLGQILVRGFIEPSLELKKSIGQISRDLDFYANEIFDPACRGEFNQTFRNHWARLNEHLYTVAGYKFFAWWFGLPPWDDVCLAAHYLLGHSNAPLSSAPEWWRDRSSEIRHLLRIRPEPGRAPKT